MERVLHNLSIFSWNIVFGTSYIATRRSAHKSSPGGQSWGLGGRGWSNYYKSCHCCALSPPSHTPRQPGFQFTHFTQLCPSGSVIFFILYCELGNIMGYEVLMATDKTVSFKPRFSLYQAYFIKCLVLSRFVKARLYIRWQLKCQQLLMKVLNYLKYDL